MRLSFEWLRDYVRVKADAEEVAFKFTMSGSEVGAVTDCGADKIMEFEITTNRPDCLNVLGLAREISAIYDIDLLIPDIPPGISGNRDKIEGIECVVKNRQLCPQYTLRIINEVNIKPSSGKIKERISSIGLRPVNNAVDITNYCLMELGQPMHVFDLDKIKGGKIIVREAVKGEKIMTIDDEERELEPGMLVIADTKRPIAIAGVMGGKDTEVSADTRNILLESAYFDPVSVRRTARRLGISTDSSYRFERGVDKSMVIKASDRAAGLIKEQSGGRISGFIKSGDMKIDPRVVDINIKRSSAILGIDLDTDQVANIIGRLGMKVLSSGGSCISVEVPSFREDISRDIDITEEIARIYGYEKIPATIPRITPEIIRKDVRAEVKERMVSFLSAAGFNEIMTYSLISEDSTNRFTSFNKKPVALSNPLSEEQKVLTTQLIDGMLRSVSWNINRKNNDLKLFEIGKIYREEKPGREYREIPVLCIGMTGSLKRNWRDGEKTVDFYDLKGTIERILDDLKVVHVFETGDIPEMAPCAVIKIPDTGAVEGYAGRISPGILRDYGIEQDVFICHVRLDNVFGGVDLKKTYRAVPRFPFSERDISILCDKTLKSSNIRDMIIKAGEDLIQDVELMDVYEGESISQNKKSLTYRITYGLDFRTLKDDEIEAVHGKIKDLLSSKLKVSFR